MKNVLLALMLAATLSHAQQKTEQPQQTLYGGLGLGIMATDDNSDAGIGLSLRGGLALDSVLKGFGLQAELNKSITDPENARHRDIDVMTFALYTTYEIKIPDSKAALRPKIGVILPNLNDDIDSRDLILSSGFGLTYDIEKNLRLYADYTVLGEKISHYSAGLEIKF